MTVSRRFELLYFASYLNVYKQIADYGVKTNHFTGALVDSLHSHVHTKASQSVLLFYCIDACCFTIVCKIFIKQHGHKQCKAAKTSGFFKPAKSGKSPDSSDSKPTDSETSQVQGSNKDSKTALIKWKLKQEWFKEFPWLPDSNRNISFCDYYIDAGRENVLTMPEDMWLS